MTCFGYSTFYLFHMLKQILTGVLAIHLFCCSLSSKFQIQFIWIVIEFLKLILKINLFTKNTLCFPWYTHHPDLVFVCEATHHFRGYEKQKIYASIIITKSLQSFFELYWFLIQFTNILNTGYITEPVSFIALSTFKNHSCHVKGKIMDNFPYSFYK